MVDLFRGSTADALTTILSRERALTTEGGSLSPEEWEILRAMDLSFSDLDVARRAFLGEADDRLRKHAEAILGFGATSPAGGFGGSSWSSGHSGALKRQSSDTKRPTPKVQLARLN